MSFVSALATALVEGSGDNAGSSWPPAESALMDNLTIFASVTSPTISQVGSGSDGDSHKMHSSSQDWPNATHSVSLFSSVFSVSYCTQWASINHVYFQLANTFFFLSYLAPNGMYGILYLRCTLLVGCAFFALWGWTVMCSFDAFLWNAAFVCINFIHVCVLLYYLRPVKFSREVEEPPWYDSISFQENYVLNIYNKSYQEQERQVCDHYLVTHRWRKQQDIAR
ncbi:blood vessel epicardial substance-like [Schistocerca gregaria]|uniref:blood vessel epicardial substance-like n=1 Tax=Schistocerca gregaria TaxID=7010 RepID=UPI00211E83F6|nr:blood vessel epicardial substance-like [Schistocerca gregaria]